MGLKLPPQFVNTPAADVFNMDLPDPVYRTLAVLHGLAWQTKGERTPPTTVLELATLRGLQERQMYNHLRALKELRRIRVENLGQGRIVIYPLRWEPGTALPPDEASSLTEAEIAELTETDKPPGQITAKNCSSTATNYSTAKNCSKQHVVVDSDSTESESDSDSKQQHEQHDFTAKNCSELAENDPTAKNCSKSEPDAGADDPDVASKQAQAPPFTAKNCSKNAVAAEKLDRAADQPEFTAKNCSKSVAETGSDQADNVAPPSSQSHQDFTAKNCSELVETIAAIFSNDGDPPDVAREKAAGLIDKYGIERCRRQVSYFPRRCELARASEDGLRNPSGLFIRSVQSDWTAPTSTQKQGTAAWYTQQEFDDLIEH
jgi:hypothetical protein